ncbi:MAG: hypothetical protein LBR16_01165 [Treponema sp.]|jgi:hypothetical protein|nr:hypothetical protein [Treponema sp.]
MKKLFVSTTIFLLGMGAAQAAPALGMTWAVGGEVNMYSSDKPYALAANFIYDIQMSNKWSIGAKLLYAHDLVWVHTVEAGVLIRSYYYNGPRVHAFLQFEGGIGILFSERTLASTAVGGISFGFRAFMGANKNAYIEPYVRAGYPYIYGAGLNLGFNV